MYVSKYVIMNAYMYICMCTNITILKNDIVLGKKEF